MTPKKDCHKDTVIQMYLGYMLESLGEYCKFYDLKNQALQFTPQYTM